MAVWDDVMPEKDSRMYMEKAGQGGRLTYGERPAIIVVDMSRCFVEDEYPFSNVEQGDLAVASIKRLLGKGREIGIPIYYTTNRPFGTPTEAGHWKMRPEGLAVMRTPEAHEIVPELAPQPGELVIVKSKPSAFFGTPLINFLIYNKVDTVMVTGMTTAGCVRATIVDAFSYDFVVIVPEECVADRGLLSHKVSLFDVHMRYADVIPLQEVMNYLDGLKAPRSVSAAVGR